MYIPRNICTLCSVETAFYITVVDGYCRDSELLEKINTCLKINVQTDDNFTAICYKCVCSVEQFYDFLIHVKKMQTVVKAKKSNFSNTHGKGNAIQTPKLNSNKAKSYANEQLIDSNFSFSFDDGMFVDYVKMKSPSPTPSKCEFQKRADPMQPRCWNVKTQPVKLAQVPRVKKFKRSSVFNVPHETADMQDCATILPSSRDIFESPGDTQDNEIDPRSFDWKLTPDDDIIKKNREKFFNRFEF